MWSSPWGTGVIGPPKDDVKNMLQQRFAPLHQRAVPRPTTPASVCEKTPPSKGAKRKKASPEVKSEDVKNKGAELLVTTTNNDVLADANSNADLIGREIARANTLIMKCQALGCGSDTVTMMSNLVEKLQGPYKSLQKLLQALQKSAPSLQ